MPKRFYVYFLVLTLMVVGVTGLNSYCVHEQLDEARESIDVYIVSMDAQAQFYEQIAVDQAQAYDEAAFSQAQFYDETWAGQIQSYDEAVAIHAQVYDEAVFSQAQAYDAAAVRQAQDYDEVAIRQLAQHNDMFVNQEYTMLVQREVAVAQEYANSLAVIVDLEAHRAHEFSVKLWASERDFRRLSRDSERRGAVAQVRLEVAQSYIDQLVEYIKFNGLLVPVPAPVPD